MKNKSRVETSIVRNLTRWYHRERRVLPWRENPTAYHVWISEIMLQQTQVKTVIPYYERFLQRLPTVEALAHAPQDEVLSLWSGLGYYSRARNLHQAAKEIVALGRWPQTRSEWMECSGIGPYTAGAISSIALEQPEPIVDGNVDRVLSRLEACTIKDPQSRRAEIWKRARVFVETAFRLKISPRDFNQALMELGALVCLPKSPRCGVCPWSTQCQALSQGKVDQIPTPKIRAKTVQKTETFFWIWDSRHRKVLLERNADTRWRKDLWDLPSGKDRKKQNSTSQKPMYTFQIQYQVTHHKISRTINVLKGRATGSSATQRWVSLEDIEARSIGIGSPVLKAAAYWRSVEAS